MRTAGLSNLSLSYVLRDSILGAQLQLGRAQVEATTGRHADVGLSLGAHAAASLSLRSRMDELQSLSDGNNLAGVRLKLTQDVLGDIGSIATKFMETLTGARGAAGGQDIARNAARTALESLTSLLNTTANGQYIFGGINSDAPPVAEYLSTPPSAAKTAIDTAFMATFSFDQTDPQVETITASAMQAFIDGPFTSLFDHGGWTAQWSQASDSDMVSRIDTGRTIASGTNANIEPIRQLARVFTMVLDLGAGQLSQSAFETVVDTSLAGLGQSMAGIGLEQSRLGIVQNEIAAATERHGLRMNLLQGEIQHLEGVDRYEASVQVNTLMTQLESSYAITGRISRLSLLNYI